MALPVGVEHIPSYVTIVLSLILAGLLLYLDFHKRANRAFAFLLIVRAANLLIGMLRSAATTEAEFLFFQRVAPYFLIPLVPAFAYFITVYPRPRTWLGTSRWGGWTIIAATLALEVAYALNHSLYWSYAPGASTTEFLVASARHGFVYTEFGPLSILGSLSVPVTCVLAFVLARDYLGERPGGARFSIVLIIAGLILSATFYGVQVLFGVPEALMDPAFPWAPWGWAFLLFPALTGPIALLALAVLWIGARRSREIQDDYEVRRLLILAPLPIISAVVVEFTGGGLFRGPSLFLLGTWRLVMPILVAYGLLRYHLFDLDVKARLTIQHGTVVGIFGLVFFVTSELAEGIVADVAGAWIGSNSEMIGLVAAGMLALAIRPLEQMGARVAGKVMPSTKPLHHLDERQRKALYNDHFAMALQDGRLTESERKMLSALAKRLGLPEVNKRASETARKTRPTKALAP